MCPYLANYTAQQLLLPRNCTLVFSPFLESESGDGLLAYVTVHITHIHTHTQWQTHKDKLVLHTSRHLTPGFRYSIALHILVFVGIYGHESCMSIRSAFPLRSYTINHTYYSYSKRVGPRGVPFKSQAFLTTVNHLRGCYNISGSHGAGETGWNRQAAAVGAVKIWSLMHRKINIPWGHRAWVVNEPGMLNKQPDCVDESMEKLLLTVQTGRLCLLSFFGLITHISFTRYLVSIWSSTLLMHYFIYSFLHLLH